MNRIETSDWLVLNNLIYKIYTIDDLSEMRKMVLEQLKLLMDFDSAVFSLVCDVNSRKFDHKVTYNCNAKDWEHYDEESLFGEILENNKSVVFRETDIIPEEVRIQLDPYHTIYIKNSLNYSLHMFLAKDNQMLGSISLFRAIGKDNFVYDDIIMLDFLKEHLSYRLSEFQRKAKEFENKITISEAVQQYELTRREETILKLLLAGIGNDDICDRLMISINTLKKHVLNIYRKLGIRNRVQMFKMIVDSV